MPHAPPLQLMMRILLVEDDQVQRKLLTVALAKAMGKDGYTVEHADRLSRALVLLRQEHFDLVLLDLGLPDSDGFDTLRITRGEAPDTAIIVLTGQDDDALGARVVREGAQDFLTKGTFPIGSLGRSISYAIERHRHLQDLRRVSLLDELTGLFNRRGFLALSWHQLKVASRTKCPTTMLFFDVDGMKTINDTLGHKHGDAALVAVAEILRAGFRESDILGRVGGDEFCALLIDDRRVLDPLPRVRKCLETLNVSDRRPYPFSVSTGAVRYDPDHPCSVEELMERADRAMYCDKQGKQEPVI